MARAASSDAEHRGLIDSQLLAGKVASFSRQYGLPRATGADLLTSLAEQAGQRLSTTDVQQAMLAGVPAGSGLLAAVTQALAPNAQAVTAQAVAAILSNPALTRQLQAMSAPIAELTAQALRSTGTAATGRHAIAAASANSSHNSDDNE